MPDSVITGAMERFKQSLDATSTLRIRSQEDVEFARLAEQWPDDVKLARREEGRPCLTVNRLPSFIRQVVNDARQNTPSIEVVPVDSGADPDAAEIMGDLIRAIEQGSQADVAYDTGLEQAATGGFGFFRVVLDYCHPESFDLEARIVRVPNPLSVVWDARTLAFDSSDWEHAFVSELLTEREFKARYGNKAKMASFDDFNDEMERIWREGDKVRIAEYWLRTERRRKIALMSDGLVARVDELEAEQEIAPGVRVKRGEFLAANGVVVVRERETTFHEVKCREMSGVEVLKETDWPGSTIPICPVWGEEVMHRGERHFRSLIRDAKDPQRMLNFWRSASTELVALAPRAPYLMPENALPPGREAEKWARANSKSYPYLIYRGAVPPQRQAFAGVPAGALQEALNASDDIKSVIGIYDAALGARSNETSGRAIMARQRESDVATFHFIDNLSRAIASCGRILVEIIPRVYGARQTIQVIGADKAAKVVQLASGQGSAVTGTGDQRVFDLTVGKYDVRVRTGPSFTTQREVAREAMMEMMTRIPAAALPLGDLAMSNMDFPQAAEAAKRVRLLQAIELARAGLPPKVDDAIAVVESGQWPPQPPPAMPADPMNAGAPPGALPVSGGM